MYMYVYVYMYVYTDNRCYHMLCISVLMSRGNVPILCIQTYFIGAIFATQIVKKMAHYLNYINSNAHR